MASKFPLPIAACLSFAIASCSSGGVGTTEVGSGPAGQETGGDASDQGNGQQAGSGGSSSETANEAASIGRQADSLLMSTVRIQRTGDPTGSIDVNPSCSSETCAGSNAGIAISNSIETTIQTAFSQTANEESVSVEQGVTLVKRTWTTTSEEGRSLVAALGRSAFGVVVETRTRAATSVQQAALTEREARRVYAVAYGERGGTRPNAAGTWRGRMAGVAGETVEFLQGDATLTYSLANGAGRLSAEFTDITNLALNAAHSTPAVRFANIEVGSSGSFSQGIQGSRIQGAFYGSSLEEIAGTFERYGIIAAYGTQVDSSSTQAPEPDTGSSGGGSGGSVPSSPQAVSPPDAGPETSSEAHTRAGSVVDQADSFLMTRTVLRSNIARWTAAEFGTTCSALTCTLDRGSYSSALWTELTGGDADMTLAEIDAYYEDAESLSGEPSEDGISVFSIIGDPLADQGEGITERVRGSFAVMQYSLFGAGQIENFADATPDEKRNLRFGWAAGELAGARPATSGTYTGVATGMAKDSGSVTNGNATLTYAVSSTGGSLSASLGSLADYTGITVSSSGSFSQSSAADNNIQGMFYGTDGGEVAGTFETSTHVGAFGANR